MDVNYLYQFMLRLIRKNQAGGLNATEFGFFWNDASVSYQDDLLGRFQRAFVGKTGNNTGLVQNETIITKLTPFIKPINIAILGGGNAIKPVDFIYTLALRAAGAPVFQVDHDQIWSLNDDVIDPPSIAANSYYYAEYQNYYTIYPATTPTIDLDYVATPALVVWGFTLDVNQREVYSPGNSTQPQWDQNSCMEITKRALKAIGVSFHDKDFEQFGQTVLNAGE